MGGWTTIRKSWYKILLNNFLSSGNDCTTLLNGDMDAETDYEVSDEDIDHVTMLQKKINKFSGNPFVSTSNVQDNSCSFNNHYNTKPGSSARITVLNDNAEELYEKIEVINYFEILRLQQINVYFIHDKILAQASEKVVLKNDIGKIELDENDLAALKTLKNINKSWEEISQVILKKHSSSSKNLNDVIDVFSSLVSTKLKSLNPQEAVQKQKQIFDVLFADED